MGSRAMCPALSALLVLLLLAAIMPRVSSGIGLESSYLPSVGGFKRVLFYYGWLSTSNILDLNIDMAIVAGDTDILVHQIDIVEQLRQRGVEVYAYLHEGDTPVGLGSSYGNLVLGGNYTVDQWVSYIEGLIDQYVGKFDGVFLDGCDPGYFGITDPNNPDLQGFSQALQEIVAHAHQEGLKVIINGVRAYAGYGDYYLWEDFVAIYDNGVYKLDTGFFTETSSNPYVWTRTITKYEYLRDHGLLGKTIALSFVDRSTIENAKYGYYMARILGLAGWAYAPIDIYASGGPTLSLDPASQLDVYEVGPAIKDPVIDPASSRASRMFLSGEVVVDLDDHYLSTPFDQYPVFKLDGDPSEYAGVVGGIEGDYATINIIGHAVTPRGLYLYIEATWKNTPADVVFHIYIDSDGSQSTGYQPWVVSGIGADYLVETYSGLTLGLHNYTGTGGHNWSWEDRISDNLFGAYYSSGGNKFVLELFLPEKYYKIGLTKICVATVYDWNDDAYYVLTPSNYVTVIPTIYDSPGSFVGDIAMIESIERTGSSITIIADAPSGMLAEYTIYVPYAVDYVAKNGFRLPEMDSPSFNTEGYYVYNTGSYSEVIVRVVHGSPVNITVYMKLQGGTGLGGNAVGSWADYTLPLAIALSIPLATCTVYMLVRRRGGAGV